MAAYLVTHSLLSSWLHLIRENPYEDLTTEGDPLAEFMLVLRREPTPRTEAMQNGIDFENLVTSIVNGRDDPNNPWNWAAGQIAAIIKGGQLQFKSRKTIRVRGMDNQHDKTAQGWLSAPLMLIGGNIMEAMLNFIPAPVAIVLMLAGFIALAIGGIRLGYKATVKDLALELVKKAELSIMGSGQGAKKKKQVFAALRAKCPAAIRWAITDEVLDTVIEHAFDVMTAALGKKS